MLPAKYIADFVRQRWTHCCDKFNAIDIYLCPDKTCLSQPLHHLSTNEKYLPEILINCEFWISCDLVVLSQFFCIYFDLLWYFSTSHAEKILVFFKNASEWNGILLHEISYVYSTQTMKIGGFQEIRFWSVNLPRSFRFGFSSLWLGLPKCWRE